MCLSGYFTSENYSIDFVQIWYWGVYIKKAAKIILFRFLSDKYAQRPCFILRTVELHRLFLNPLVGLTGFVCTKHVLC